jgi:hypothetical protein
MNGNWYYFYNPQGIEEETIKDLSGDLENLGYSFHQPMGLGAGPSPEQIVLWVHNNEFLLGTSINILSSFIYDVLKVAFNRLKAHNFQEKTPVVQVFLNFPNVNNPRINARLKFSVEQNPDKTQIGLRVKSQMEYVFGSSDDESICSICKRNLPKHTSYYLKSENLGSPICYECYEKINV